MTHSGPRRGLTRAIRLGLLLSATNALASIGPFGGNVTGLAIDPAQPDTLNAATRSGGIFKSEDGGTTWFEANNGIALHDRSRDHTRVRLTIDPSQLKPSTWSTGERRRHFAEH